MCGIVGVFGHHPVSGILYDSLSMLQHRGQDAAGIATCYQDRFYLHKENGLVTAVFNPANMSRLLGNMGIGHVPDCRVRFSRRSPAVLCQLALRYRFRA